MEGRGSRNLKLKPPSFANASKDGNVSPFLHLQIQVLCTASDFHFFSLLGQDILLIIISPMFMFHSAPFPLHQSQLCYPLPGSVIFQWSHLNLHPPFRPIELVILLWLPECLQWRLHLASSPLFFHVIVLLVPFISCYRNDL